MKRLNVHIIGLAGSGKTTLARWCAQTFDISSHDLDRIVFDRYGERPPAEIERRIEAISRVDGWVTEGAYQQEWIRLLLERADAVVWLDLPLYKCMFRMVKRHARAELTRTNQHPGWVKLLRFLNYTRRTSGRQRQQTTELLSGYGRKVARCRTSRDVSALKRRLVLAHGR